MTHKPKRSSRRLSVFGLALLASLALTAFAASSASALKLTTSGGIVAEGPFSIHNAPNPAPAGISVANVGNYSCENSGAGGGGIIDEKTGEGGTISLELTGCKFMGVKCTTPGQAAGTILTPKLDFKFVYLDASKTQIGMHITPPPSTNFAKCAWGIWQVPVEWDGSLLIGVVAALNEAKASFPMEVSGSAGQQQHQQIEGAGPLYHLSHTFGGEAANDMAINTGWTLWFPTKYKFVP